MNTNTKKMCIIGLLTALTCVATMIIKVPITATGGYINIGDSMVLICAVFFGPEYGLIAGGIGSALGDLLGGYFNWALATVIIKGIEGLAVAKIAGTPNKGSFLNLRKVSACVIGLVWMVAGYFAADYIIGGSIAASIAGISANSIQAVFSFIVFIVLGFALYKAKIQNYID